MRRGLGPDYWAAIIRLAGSRCVHCDGSAGLQVDHVRPVHAGGLNWPANLVPLCGEHNKIKSCYWPGHGYHPVDGFDDRDQARLILISCLNWLGQHGGWRQPLLTIDETGTWWERELLGTDSANLALW